MPLSQTAITYIAIVSVIGVGLFLHYLYLKYQQYLVFMAFKEKLSKVLEIATATMSQYLALTLLVDPNNQIASQILNLISTLTNKLNPQPIFTPVPNTTKLGETVLYAPKWDTGFDCCPGDWKDCLFSSGCPGKKTYTFCNNCPSKEIKKEVLTEEEKEKENETPEYTIDDCEIEVDE